MADKPRPMATHVGGEVVDMEKEGWSNMSRQTLARRIWGDGMQEAYINSQEVPLDIQLDVLS